MPEIIVGVIKPTRFDPKPDKRLFIYRIADEAYIRPLWLGSRVAQPLEDFRVIREHTPVLIRTMERERSGKYLIDRIRQFPNRVGGLVCIQMNDIERIRFFVQRYFHVSLIYLPFKPVFFPA